MDLRSTGRQGEERRRRVTKKRRVTRLTIGGKEVSEDALKDPCTLEFPDPGRRYRKFIICGIIAIFVILSALLFILLGDLIPREFEMPPGTLR